MYTSYLRDRDDLPSNQLMEIRFEDLLADPLQQIESLYEQLELGPFHPNRENIKQYFEKRGDHKKNANRLNAGLESWIDEHWQDYREAFGY